MSINDDSVVLGATTVSGATTTGALAVTGTSPMIVIAAGLGSALLAIAIYYLSLKSGKQSSK